MARAAKGSLIALAGQLGLVRGEDVDHLREDLGRRRDHLAAVQEVAFAREVADEAAGFLHEKASCRDVPGIEPDFPEAVVEARRDVGEIERGGAGPAQPRGVLDHRLHHLEVGVEIAAVAERKAGADEAVSQMIALRHAHPVVVEIGAAAARRGEEIVAHRIVDHRLRDQSLLREGDRHAVLRESVQEVGGAVERIDDPDVLGVGIVAFGRALFREDRMVRVGVEQRVDDRAFRRAVDLAHEVLRPLRRDGQPVEVAGAAADHVAGTARGFHRDGERGVH